MCLESKAKVFFEKHTESSDEGESLDIAQNVDINANANALNANVRYWKSVTGLWRRAFCFADFLKAYWRPYKAYIVTFIGESGVDTEGVSREFYPSL